MLLVVTGLNVNEFSLFFYIKVFKKIFRSRLSRLKDEVEQICIEYDQMNNF